MNSTFRIFASVLFLAAIGLLTTGFAPASSMMATVGLYFSSSGCVMLDGDGGIVSADSEFIIGPQENQGNTVVRCYVEGLTNTTGSAVVIRGAGTCFAFGMQTTNWSQVITPDGRGRLRCTFN